MTHKPIKISHFVVEWKQYTLNIIQRNRDILVCFGWKIDKTINPALNKVKSIFTPDWGRSHSLHVHKSNFLSAMEDRRVLIWERGDSWHIGARSCFRSLEYITGDRQIWQSQKDVFERFNSLHVQFKPVASVTILRVTPLSVSVAKALWKVLLTSPCQIGIQSVAQINWALALHHKGAGKVCDLLLTDNSRDIEIYEMAQY